MRNKFIILLFGALLSLSACQQADKPSVSPESNVVTVIGAIHGQHKRSEQYSLDVLRGAITKFNPDIILVELPPERFETASRNFEQYGEVRESRADDFPELVNVVFPLREKLGFKMVPVAAWSQDIADQRKAAEDAVQNNPERANDWDAYQAAIATYNETINGQSDDPQFVHSKAYDEAVKARQSVYEERLGGDLGVGGWDAINEAHGALMTKALDEVSGEQKRVLILFGAWHKYKIMELLEARSDVTLSDAADLF